MTHEEQLENMMSEALDKMERNQRREVEGLIEEAKAAMELAKNEGRAICLKICLPGERSFDYWIDTNSHVVELLQKEIKLMEDELRQLPSIK